MENKNDPIRVYVACLASYNNGILHGEWIDATQDEDEIWRDVSQMLLNSPAEHAEEWAIHDHEGFGDILVSEHASFETIAQYAQIIEEHGEVASKLITYFGNIEDAETALNEHYAGEYENLEDYAEELTEQTTQIPENLRYYIDYEKMAHDLAINDVMTVEVGHSVHVFWRF